ncbi:MAG TPA: 50S ribosome-binding GTPase, partial [Alphaproteobacteria bacterium]|nr:50S ribosome-binding GTPase [Alphaproteobacteria bacterium]
SRERVPYPVVALVGYTNAGKSTLFNKLTGAEVFAKDLLFATLDPTMRRLKLPKGRDVILSDTVGFISDLPTHLIAAFRATLEQVQYADVILHVRDISSPETEAQREDVVTILKDIGVDYDTDDRVIEVLNKIDLCEDRHWLREPGLKGRQIPVSAVTGEGLEALLESIEGRLTCHYKQVTIDLDSSNGKAFAWLHRHASVLDKKEDGDHIHLTVSIDEGEYQKYLGLFGPISA